MSDKINKTPADTVGVPAPFDKLDFIGPGKEWNWGAMPENMLTTTEKTLKRTRQELIRMREELDAWRTRGHLYEHLDELNDIIGPPSNITFLAQKPRRKIRRVPK